MVVILAALILAGVGSLKLWSVFDFRGKPAVSEPRPDESVSAPSVLAQTRSAHNRLLLGDFAGGCEALRAIAAKHPEIYSARRVPALLKLHGLVPGFDGESYNGNALDLIILFCGRTGRDLSVDPEAAADLAAMAVAIEDFPGLRNTEQLALALEPLGVTFKPVPVVDGRRTQLITTHALWAYSEALWALDRDDPARARIVLEGVEPTTTWAGRHVEVLRRFLTVFAREAAELDSLESRTDRAISPILLRGKSEVGPELQSEARAAAAQLAQFVEQTLKAGDFSERIEQALREGFVREALWLIAQYDRRQARFCGLEERLRKARIEPGFHAQDILAPERKALEQGLRSRLTMVEKLVLGAEKRFMLDVDGAGGDYKMARALDRLDIKARIGCGLFIPKAHLDAVRELQKLAPYRQDEKDRDRLARSLSEEGRPAMAALVTTNDNMSMTTPVPGASGIAFGLSAAETDAVFAVQVQLGARRPPAPDVPATGALSRVDSDPLWQRLKGSGNVPIFLESGMDDPVAAMSGSAVFTWLAAGAAGQFGDQAISVGFRTTFPGVGTDSLGAAMALAGWSRLHGVSLVKGVAITGCIKPDGSLVEAISLPDKIWAAHRRHAAELILVPAANAPALDAVPLDQLLRTVLVTAGDMTHVLRYAAFDETPRTTPAVGGDF